MEGWGGSECSAVLELQNFLRKNMNCSSLITYTQDGGCVTFTGYSNTLQEPSKVYTDSVISVYSFKVDDDDVSVRTGL